MKAKVQMVVYQCNGCGKQKIVDEEIDGPPNGYHGRVAETVGGLARSSQLGGSGMHEFYACSNRCIGKAVQNAIKSGLSRNNTDEELTADDLAEERAHLAETRGYPADETDADESDDEDDDMRARGLYPEGVPEPLER